MRQQELLKKLAEQKKLSHAYLFSGNDHAQKEELVLALLEILSVQLPDQMQISPEEEGSEAEITIAQIRSLTAFFSMSAWNSPCKAAILQGAHCMNWEAQSAFLKLLEEPKGNAVFFLLTEYPDELLSTIRSRVQEFKFYSFAPTEIAERDIAEFEKLQKADLTTRFAHAKKLADPPAGGEQITQTLHEWSMAARQLLHAAVKENPQAIPLLLGAIRAIQETAVLLRTTNVNPRLALEHIMLNL